MGNRYTYGQLVRVSFTFTDSARNPQDPEAVFFAYIDPEGTETELEYGADDELVKDDTGEYHVDLSCDIAGEYRYRAYGTGSGQAAVEGEFRVKDTEFD